MISYCRNDPENKSGTCGIIEIFERNNCNSIVDVSTSSMNISPFMWAIRKRAPINDDLPAPVRPTTQVFVFGNNSNEMFCKTGSFSYEYLYVTLRN